MCLLRIMVRVGADYIMTGATLCKAPSLISVLMLKQEMLGVIRVMKYVALYVDLIY